MADALRTLHARGQWEVAMPLHFERSHYQSWRLLSDVLIDPVPSKREEIAMGQKKKPNNKDEAKKPNNKDEAPRRSKQDSAGANAKSSRPRGNAKAARKAVART